MGVGRVVWWVLEGLFGGCWRGCLVGVGGLFGGCWRGCLVGVGGLFKALVEGKFGVI